MKKLMTMIAAAATAFGLYAGDTGTSFEDGIVGETLESQADTITELSDPYTAWAGFNNDATIQLHEAQTLGTNFRSTKLEETNDNYLKLATGTNVLWRNVGNSAFDVTVGNLYFDSVVRFTAFDSDPEIDANAKVAVWLQEDLDADENPVATNLMVKANEMIYNCGDGQALVDQWKRLTIKAIKVTDSQIGFVIYVNGKNDATVQATPIAWTGTETLDTTGFTSVAKKYAGLKQLFLSNTSDTTVTAAGFAGMGGVDDIVFTEDAPAFAPDYKFYYIDWDSTVANVTGCAEKPTEFIVDGAAKTFEYTAADGYIDGTTNITGLVGRTYTITAAKLAATVYVKESGEWVAVDGGQVSTFADALAKVGTDGEYMIQLGQDEGAITIDKACDLTLDLAGKEIKSEDGDAITVTAGALTIIDSDEEKKGKVTAGYDDGWSYAVSADSAVVMINAGTFDGSISLGDDSWISGGKFLIAANEELEGVLNEWKPEDAEFVEKDDSGYWELQTVTDFTVEVPEAKPNTKLFVTINNGTPSTTNGTYTVAKASTLKAVYTADEGYELEGQGEWKIDYDSKDTVITAPTAKRIMVDFTVVEVENATLLAVSNGTEEVIADQGKYTVPTNATVVLYYAPKSGYRLTETTAEVPITTAGQEVNVSDEIAPTEITYVAKIGSAMYETLGEAIAALTGNNETIMLLNDYAAGDEEDLMFKANGTLDLGGKKLTLSYTLLDRPNRSLSAYVGAAEGVTVTLQNGEIEYLKGEKSDGSFVGSSYGFKVAGGAVLNANCKITRPGNGPAFDIYGGTVNCSANTEIDAGADIFRFKDNNLTSYVHITGGKLENRGSGNASSIFHLYKAGHTANIAITGGEFKFTSYLIDAYAEVKDKVTNAPPALVFTKLDANNAARFSKQVLVAPQGTTIIEDKDLLAADCKVVVDTEIVGVTWYKVAAIKYATLAVAADEGITYVLTNKTTDAVVQNGYQADIDNAEVIEAVEIAVTAEGYELDPASVLTTTLNTATPAAIVLKKQLKTFEVTFYGDSEKTNMLATQQVQYNGYVTEVSAPTRDGFEFQGWNPSTNVAITAAAEFCATWKSAVKPIEPVEPGKDIETDEPQKLADEINNAEDKTDWIKAPNNDALTEAQKVAYAKYFKAVAGEGKVTIEFNEAKTAELTEEINTEVVKIKPADVAAGTATEVTIDTIPGFYYAVKQGNGIGNMTNPAVDTPAGTEAKLTLSLTPTQGAGFYQIIVSEKPIPATVK